MKRNSNRFMRIKQKLVIVCLMNACSTHHYGVDNTNVSSNLSGKLVLKKICNNIEVLDGGLKKVAIHTSNVAHTLSDRLDSVEQLALKTGGQVKSHNTRLEGYGTRLEGYDTKLEGHDTKLEELSQQLDEVRKQSTNFEYKEVQPFNTSNASAYKGDCCEEITELLKEYDLSAKDVDSFSAKI